MSSSRPVSKPTFALSPEATPDRAALLRAKYKTREALRRREIARCMEGQDGLPGALYWVREHTETFDEHHLSAGVEPYRKFPRKDYFTALFRAFDRERRLFLPKSREMMATWSMCAYAVWTAQFHPRQRVMIQAQKKEKVVDLMKGKVTPGYARTLIERQ